MEAWKMIVLLIGRWLNLSPYLEHSSGSRPAMQTRWHDTVPVRPRVRLQRTRALVEQGFVFRHFPGQRVHRVSSCRMGYILVYGHTGRCLLLR